MRRDHHRRAEGGLLAQCCQHDRSRIRIELGGGLVRDDESRLRHQRSRHRDPLALTTRELFREPITRIVEACAFESTDRSSADLRGRDTAQLERELDVLVTREHRQESVTLQDDARERRAISRLDRPLVRRDQPREHGEQGRLPRTVGSKHRPALSFFNYQLIDLEDGAPISNDANAFQAGNFWHQLFTLWLLMQSALDLVRV